MVRGLLASMMVGILCAVMGTYVVLRGMAFLGDAMAHAILPGVAIAFLLHGNLLVGAMIAAVIIALSIGLFSKGGTVKEDTAIGILFAAALSLGVALISSIQTYAVDLSHILFGNVLGVSISDLWLTAGLGLLVLVSVALFYKQFLVISFDPILAATLRLPAELLRNLMLVLLALTVVVSLQTVGVGLAAAMLVTPAATAYLLTRRLWPMMLVSAGIGAISSLVGLYVSYYLNIVSGSAIVLTAISNFPTGFSLPTATWFFVEEKINMPRGSLFVIVITLFLLGSCSGSGLSLLPTAQPTVSYNLNALPTQTLILGSTDSITVTPTIPITSASTPVLQSIPDLPLYTLIARLDYAAHSLEVDETIFYPNTTGDTLPDLVMAVEPNLWKGCFVLGDLLINGQNVGTLNLVGDRLVVPLAEPLPPGGYLTLSVQYGLNLPAADIHHVFGYNNRQINLADWYPFIVPYSSGWILHPPADLGEHLTYDVADFDVTVTLADPSIPVTLAASAPADETSGSWHYRLQNARTFVFSGSTAYQKMSATSDGVTITSYYFDTNESPARGNFGRDNQVG